ncbi:MAG TPA: hypothetical protein DD979_08910 [Gammaproteobacteria bacterium]|nr:hypothetical protein [Gammaproteobacteria bacterium]
MDGSVIAMLVVLALGAYGIVLYNRLVTLKNEFKNAFSQIDVQLQRRYELIPNLVETAKGYLQHEQQTLTAVTEARDHAKSQAEAAAAAPDNAGLVKSLAQAESALGSALGRLNVVVESYPELKADANMQALFDELVTTDNRVTFARQAYSDSVMLYNTQREVFPSNLVAGVFAFREADLFEINDPDIAQPARVSFA